ncbi:MAG: hypothetical protein Q8P18_17855 [Pseudomonadota bacterium]|nr:hypothetical protein [Pseudomonadota bacterium]
MMLFLWAATLLAETGDTADTADTADEGGRDTSAWLDTGAVAEEVYVQDVGCAALPGGGGPVTALLALGLCAAVAWGRGARG